ncbi:hypothetical protein [Rhizobium leguminosarum]|uniref:hypothetical protein n=1 Tax=Rhizobium leguminosarum TaxID=384 RepID=UPI001FE0D394|nr:hypothetical protein [Rhizobium leguminosarum]
MLADIEQKELADKAELNVNTIRNMESAGGGPIAGRAGSVQAVQRILETMGIEFLNHGRPGVRVRGPVRWRRTRDGDVPPDGVEVTINYTIGNQQVQTARFDSTARTWQLSNPSLTLPESEVPQWTPHPGVNDPNQWASKDED